jgi:hypothetical protein
MNPRNLLLVATITILGAEHLLAIQHFLAAWLHRLLGH